MPVLIKKQEAGLGTEQSGLLQSTLSKTPFSAGVSAAGRAESEVRKPITAKESEVG